METDRNSTNVDKSRWVKNLSNKDLSDVEVSALKHGFGYSIVPKEIPVGNILAEIESGIFKMDDMSKQMIGSSVTNILKGVKPQKEVNITKEEENALKTLSRDKNIVILPADKGKAIVVMNSCDYQHKLHDLLDDNKTYYKITDKRRNPVTSTEREMNTLLSELSRTASEHDPEKSQIDAILYRYLHSTDATPATFYGLPKIHKTTIPLRPITSSIGSPTYNLSKFLTKLLSPLLTNRYTVKNSVIFGEKIKNYTIEEDEVMVSFDVVSLFTSIPVDLALRVTNTRLDNDDILHMSTNLSKANVLKLFEFVLNHCFFSCGGFYYQQIFGCPMGSPVSALLANLVMEEIEHQAITTAIHPPKWWFRYVDDSHCCLKKNEIDSFHQHLNAMNAEIRFTMEQESDAGLAFLDTITSRVNGNINVDVYRKPTHTDKYLDYKSHHPLSHKRSVVNTLLRRAKSIPSTDDLRKKELQHVKGVLSDNNYPCTFVEKCERKLELNNKSSSSNIEQATFTVVLPYVRGVSEKLQRTLKRHNIQVAHRPIKRLANMLPRPKDPREKNSRTNIVYKLNCQECDFVYYGQTERSLKTRTNEHKRAIVRNFANSKIAQHVNVTGHTINFDEIKIVATEQHFHKRLFLEAWHSVHDVNAGNDHIVIPDVYSLI